MDPWSCITYPSSTPLTISSISLARRREMVELVTCWLCPISFNFFLSSLAKVRLETIINYIYFACVCLYPINVKRLNRSGLKFVWDLTWPQERFMNDQNFKISLQLNLIFIKFLKINNFFYKIRQVFCYCFTMYKKRKCSQLNRRWAQPSWYKNIYLGFSMIASEIIFTCQISWHGYLIKVRRFLLYFFC